MSSNVSIKRSVLKHQATEHASFSEASSLSQVRFLPFSAEGPSEIDSSPTEMPPLDGKD